MNSYTTVAVQIFIIPRNICVLISVKSALISLLFTPAVALFIFNGQGVVFAAEYAQYIFIILILSDR